MRPLPVPAAIKLVFTPLRLAMFDRRRYAGATPVAGFSVILFIFVAVAVVSTFITGFTFSAEKQTGQLTGYDSDQYDFSKEAEIPDTFHPYPDE